MLYTLGRFLEESSKRFEDTPLNIYVSKIEFIETILQLSIISKKERAIYKNLQELEDEKYIKYKNMDLSLSRKGLKAYKEITKSLVPYFHVTKKIIAGNLLQYRKRTQTKFQF